MLRLFLLCPAAVALALVAGCGSDAPAAKSSRPTGVQVSVSACGQGWTSSKAGPATFDLHNTDTRSGEVDLVAAESGAVYAEVEPIAAGTHQTLRVSLAAGRYAFRCFMEDEPMVAGPAVTLHGSARGDAPAVAAVSQGDLIPASKAYEAYVIKALPGLVHAVTVLDGDVGSGDLAAARRDWLPAHLAYIRLGAAYGAFGDVDGDINGLADGLSAGVRDASWRGFHRLEYGLWHGQPASALRPIAAGLVSDVRGLQRDFPKTQVAPLDIGIRAHEITEDAVGFALTGRDDYGSHSSIATVRADIDATRAVLNAVHDALAPRYRGLPAVEADLTTTAADLDALRAGATWPALTSLSRADRERVNADVSQLAEELAPVATILEPRRTS